jgi:predicted DNA-binding transcriptional regulator YafY
MHASAKAHRRQLLDNLLAKIKGALDDGEKHRIGPDLEPLIKFQTTLFQPGPRVDIEAEALAAVQQAMISGNCLEFDYLPGDADDTKWRRVIPLGMIHGPTTYLVGKFPDREIDPAIFRLDRMSNARPSEVIGVPPDDWNLEVWMEQSASIWREEEYDIVLRVMPDGVERARNWCFHPRQVIEEDGDGLIVRFRAGGLWQIADHVFTWRGELVIVGPEELKVEMRGRLATAIRLLRPDSAE